MEFLLHESGARVVLVTSPRPGEGKSSVAANLAVTAAQAGRNVVLIDGDLRKPQIHRSFGLRNDRGLSSVLSGDSTLSQAVTRTDAEPNLVILPSGPPPPDPAELLVSDRLGKAIDGLAKAADLVVIDAPPVLPVTDSTILAQHCDAVLLAATSGLSDRREWQETLERLAVVQGERDRHGAVAPRCPRGVHHDLPLRADGRAGQLVGGPGGRCGASEAGASDRRHDDRRHDDHAEGSRRRTGLGPLRSRRIDEAGRIDEVGERRQGSAVTGSSRIGRPRRA